jgi:hypothetical protein
MKTISNAFADIIDSSNGRNTIVAIACEHGRAVAY